MSSPSNSEFQDGGLRLDSGVIVGEPEGDSIRRPVDENGTFFEKVQIRDYELDPGALMGAGLATISFFHELGDSSVGLSLIKQHDDPFILALRSSDIRERHEVEMGPHIEFTILFDASLSEVNFTYDNNLDDGLSPLSYGPFAYAGEIEEVQKTKLVISADGSLARAVALLDFWSLVFRDGDFNNDGVLSATDIDMLMAEIRAETHDLRFNLNADEVVDRLDRNIWVHDLKNTWFGDSNLDGEFNSTDLVEVFQPGEYEDGIDANSTWATGDWNGDSESDSSDIVLAFADGGYEVGPRLQAQLVPEPPSAVLLLPLLSVIWLRRSKTEGTRVK